MTRYKQQVPHSQCSLRENPKFLRNFSSKNNTLIEKFWLIYLFNICLCNSGLAFRSKNYNIAEQNCTYFVCENSQKLRQKRKRALWMRHLTSKVKILSGYILTPLLSWLTVAVKSKIYASNTRGQFLNIFTP